MPIHFRETSPLVSTRRKEIHHDIREALSSLFAYIRDGLSEIDLDRGAVLVDIPHQSNLMTPLIIIALVDTDGIYPQSTVGICTESSECTIAVFGDVEQLAITEESRASAIVPVFCGLAVGQSLVVWRV